MEKKVYMEKLFSNRREKLIDMCLDLQRKGRGFIYIMPSSAAIFQVRDRFAEVNRGFLNSRVIVFDDLELEIVKGFIDMEKAIYEPMDRIIIGEVCKCLKDEFRYYGNIYNKRGLHQEITSFIRTLKRSLVDEEKLQTSEKECDDKILKNKLHDLRLIFNEYNKVLMKNGIYDRNDISQKAAEFVKQYRRIRGIDTVIIDGFTDIEPVSMRLVEEIANLKRVNIYVNCPYENKFSTEFLRSKIAKPFEGMGFEVQYDEGNQNEILPEFKELCNKFYSGEKMETKPTRISIEKFPSIEVEVREAARSIKKRIMEGEAPDNIGIYVNNKEAYSESIVKIFKEFNIPVSLSHEISIGSSEIIRKMIKGFECIENKTLKADEWFSLFEEEMDKTKEYMLELVSKALNEEVNFVDRLELKAFEGLKNFAESARSSFEKSGMIQDILTREYFIAYMLEGISATNISMEQGNNRGVKVMDTALAKGIYFNHIHIFGLNEGEIPANAKSSGLFDSFELSALNKLGLKYMDFLWELTREKLRFNLALASVKNSLSLSYRGSDEDGKFAIASSFIDEIKFLAGVEESRTVTMRDRFEINFDNVMSDNELERSFIKNYFERKYRNVLMKDIKDAHALIKDLVPNINDDVKIGMVEHHREMEKSFNEYEGIMDKCFEGIASSIAVFSPSALNEYLKCPFKYMINYLNKPGEEIEDESEYSNLEIGNLYHEVLYLYYKKTNNFNDLDEKLFSEVFNEAWNSLRELQIQGEELIRRRDEFYSTLKNFISLDIKRYKNYEKQSKGRVLRPFILEGFAEGRKDFEVDIRCKIDRIDLEYALEDGKMVPTGKYVIYDYKKKGISGINEILENSDFQLPIYYYASRELLKKELKVKEMECMALLYLSIEKTQDKMELDGIYKSEYKKLLGITKRSDIKSENFEPLMEHIRGTILKTVGLIKEGKFNYKPVCSFIEDYGQIKCQYEGLCRYSKNKMRVLLEE